MCGAAPSQQPCRLQENCAILKELVALRAQKCSLLGFRTHADYVLEMNMAKTSQAVATFLGDCGCPDEGGRGGGRSLTAPRLPQTSWRRS